MQSLSILKTTLIQRRACEDSGMHIKPHTKVIQFLKATTKVSITQIRIKK